MREALLKVPLYLFCIGYTEDVQEIITLSQDGHKRELLLYRLSCVGLNISVRCCLMCARNFVAVAVAVAAVAVAAAAVAVAAAAGVTAAAAGISAAVVAAAAVAVAAVTAVAAAAA